MDNNIQISNDNINEAIEETIISDIKNGNKFSNDFYNKVITPMLDKLGSSSITPLTLDLTTINNELNSKIVTELKSVKILDDINIPLIDRSKITISLEEPLKELKDKISSIKVDIGTIDSIDKLFNIDDNTSKKLKNDWISAKEKLINTIGSGGKLESTLDKINKDLEEQYNIVLTRNQPEEPAQSNNRRPSSQLAPSNASSNNEISLEENKAVTVSIARIEPEAEAKFESIFGKGKKSSKTDTDFPNMAPSEQDIMKFFGAFSGDLLGSLGITGILGSLIAAAPALLVIGLLIKFAYDGLEGYFKADEWGVSKSSGVIGNMLAGGAEGGDWMGALKAAGQWALTLGTIGMAFGPIGGLIGALVGLAVGGIFGWIGAEKISKWINWAQDSLSKWLSECELFKSFTALITSIWELFSLPKGSPQREKIISDIAGNLFKLWQDLGSALNWLWEHIVNSFKKLLDGAKAWAENIWMMTKFKMDNSNLSGIDEKAAELGRKANKRWENRKTDEDSVILEEEKEEVDKLEAQLSFLEKAKKSTTDKNAISKIDTTIKQINELVRVLKIQKGYEAKVAAQSPSAVSGISAIQIPNEPPIPQQQIGSPAIPQATPPATQATQATPAIPPAIPPILPTPVIQTIQPLQQIQQAQQAQQTQQTQQAQQAQQAQQKAQEEAQYRILMASIEAERKKKEEEERKKKEEEEAARKKKEEEEAKKNQAKSLPQLPPGASNWSQVLIASEAEKSAIKGKEYRENLGKHKEKWWDEVKKANADKSKFYSFNKSRREIDDAMQANRGNDKVIKELEKLAKEMKKIDDYHWKRLDPHEWHEEAKKFEQEQRAARRQQQQQQQQNNSQSNASPVNRTPAYAVRSGAATNAPGNVNQTRL